ncbi:response regulator [Rhizobium sp. SIMBA_035]
MTRTEEPKARFLIVDDDKVFGDRLALALSSRGFRAATATCLDAAYAALCARNFDVLITDLRIGNESGLDLVAAMQREFPFSKILVLTGYGSVPAAVTAVKLGATEFLSKPADADEILEILGFTRRNVELNDATLTSPQLMRWEHISSVFEATGKNVSMTARKLNMHRRTLQRLLARGRPQN